MTKIKKPVMTFSELVYAIQNRGKTMNMKESVPMSLPKEQLAEVKDDETTPDYAKKKPDNRNQAEADAGQKASNPKKRKRGLLGFKKD